MSCPQDSYYTTDQYGSCGLCGGIYSGAAGTGWGSCGTTGQPGCCPGGTVFSGRQTKIGEYCGGASCAWICQPPHPSMDDTARIKCCTGINLPNNNPHGYCDSGWCPQSENCISYMTSHCTNDNLETDECAQFCRNNPGKCDKALLQYCANFTDPVSQSKHPVCGCSLPSDQYGILKALTPEGIAVPISCDARCANNASIRLQGQPNCDINSICVANFQNVDVKQGITVNQNCPGTITPVPPGTVTYTGFFQKILSTTKGKIIFGVIIIIFFILLISLIVWLSSKGKHNEATAADIE
jgi:hypothetical protein